MARTVVPSSTLINSNSYDMNFEPKMLTKKLQMLASLGVFNEQKVLWFM
jgi:hypothetical protein